MKTIFKNLCLCLAAALLFLLSGCRGVIPNEPMLTDKPNVVSENINTLPPQIDGEPYQVGELYGSYLTMYIGHVPAEYRGVPYMRVFDTYQEVSDYFDETVEDYLYGKRFTLALASFTDEFLAENDVMIVSINEPSSYVNHTAEPLTVTENEVMVNITRHIRENAPLNDTQYHLVFTAPNGGFDGIRDKELKINISEIIDPENSSAFDAERYRLYYPEYLNFCYRADALTNDPKITLRTITDYEALVFFYEDYKEVFDLDSEFRQYISTLYNWEICERYVLIITLIPCATTVKPTARGFFVNNLEMYMTIDADQPQFGESPAACYLLLTAVEKSDLQGVNLESVNISFE